MSAPMPTPIAEAVPHSRDLQDAVIGCCLLGKPHVGDVLDAVPDRLLHGDDAQALLGVIRSMHGAGVVVDVAGVRERLRVIPDARRQSADSALLRAVDASRLVDPAAIPVHIEQLRRYSDARALHEIGLRALVAARNPESAREAFSPLAQALLESGAGQSDRQLRRIGEVARDVWDEIEHRDDPDYVEKFRSVSTGFTDLDNCAGAMQGYVLLAARPGMGKTALSLRIALNIARNLRIPVLYETLEMSDLEIAGRALASIAKIDTRKFSDSRFPVETDEMERLAMAISDLDGLPIILQQAPSSALEIQRDAQRVAAMLGQMPVIMLDLVSRLQELLGASYGDSRATQCGRVSGNLKGVSRLLNTPLIAMVHMNRTSENERRAPRLSDLLDSGGWEREADRVMFLYDGPGDDGKPNQPGTMQVIVAKNRGGPKGTVRIAWVPQFTLFGNLDTRHGNPHDRRQEVHS